MLVLNTYQVGFRPGSPCTNISTEFSSGTSVALLGMNGAGKSAILLGIGGIVFHCGGRISLDGNDISRKEADKRVSMGIFSILQDKMVFGNLSVLENFRLYLGDQQFSHSLPIIHSVLEELNMKHIMSQSFACNLSGGEQKIVAALATIIRQPKIILCDELDSGLPFLVNDYFFREFRLLQRTMGTILIFATHNITLALRYADRIIIIINGTVSHDLTANDSGVDNVLKYHFL